MLGPLPYLHRLLLVSIALLVSAGIGAWFGFMPEVPVGVSLGTLVGLLAGAGAAYALVHDFHRREVNAARVRHR